MPKLLLSFLALLTIKVLNAQRTVDGYYVRLNGDTVVTKVEIPLDWSGPDWDRLNSIASFYPQNENKVAYVRPDQISAYGFVFKKNQYDLTSETALMVHPTFTGTHTSQDKKFMLNVCVGPKVKIYKIWRKQYRTHLTGPYGTGMTGSNITLSMYTIVFDKRSFFLTDEASRSNVQKGIASVFSNYPGILNSVNLKSISRSNLEAKLIQIAKLINSSP